MVSSWSSLGGVDSTFLLKVAHTVLGDQAIGVAAAAPTMHPGELEAKEKLATVTAYLHITIVSGVAPQPLPKIL